MSVLVNGDKRRRVLQLINRLEITIGRNRRSPNYSLGHGPPDNSLKTQEWGDVLCGVVLEEWAERLRLEVGDALLPDDTYGGSYQPLEATEYLPGSLKKIEVMIARVERRESAFCNRDRLIARGGAA